MYMWNPKSTGEEVYTHTYTHNWEKNEYSKYGKMLIIMENTWEFFTLLMQLFYKSNHIKIFLKVKLQCQWTCLRVPKAFHLDLLLKLQQKGSLGVSDTLLFMKPLQLSSKIVHLLLASFTVTFQLFPLFNNLQNKKW